MRPELDVSEPWMGSTQISCTWFVVLVGGVVGGVDHREGGAWPNVGTTPGVALDLSLGDAPHMEASWSASKTARRCASHRGASPRAQPGSKAWLADMAVVRTAHIAAFCAPLDAAVGVSVYASPLLGSSSGLVPSLGGDVGERVSSHPATLRHCFRPVHLHPAKARHLVTERSELHGLGVPLALVGSAQAVRAAVGRVGAVGAVGAGVGYVNVGAHVGLANVGATVGRSGLVVGAVVVGAAVVCGLHACKTKLQKHLAARFWHARCVVAEAHHVAASGDVAEPVTPRRVWSRRSRSSDAAAAATATRARSSPGRSLGGIVSVNVNVSVTVNVNVNVEVNVEVVSMMRRDELVVHAEKTVELRCESDYGVDRVRGALRACASVRSTGRGARGEALLLELAWGQRMRRNGRKSRTRKLRRQKARDHVHDVVRSRRWEWGEAGSRSRSPSTRGDVLFLPSPNKPWS